MPIGTFARVDAWIEEDDGRALRLAAELRAEEKVLARAGARFVRAAE